MGCLEDWEPREAFEATGGYDPWERLGIGCATYNSTVDEQALAVLKGIRDGLFNTDIAKHTGMSREHVELFQYIFCSADWCEYGTSPRGCFPMDYDEFGKIVENFEKHIEVEWGGD